MNIYSTGKQFTLKIIAKIDNAKSISIHQILYSETQVQLNALLNMIFALWIYANPVETNGLIRSILRRRSYCYE
jgi:hypothetical protein